MRSLFAICGDSGSGKSTMALVLSQYLSNTTVLECDRYHKWERGDPHWKSVTHLNPNANDIGLMIKDVAALRRGRSIIRRDYDHDTGKFTEDQPIEAQDNVVVCGLHTFYCPQSVYDLKIFMDTDSVLKVQWKIDRDIRKRGSTFSKVKKQIEVRKQDYTSFLAPYAQDADVIVNFCVEDDTSYLDSVKGVGRLLRIFVKSTYDVSEAVVGLKKAGVVVEACQSSRFGFQEFLVTNYKKIDKNHYYDYIMMYILEVLKIKCLSRN